MNVGDAGGPIKLFAVGTSVKKFQPCRRTYSDRHRDLRLIFAARLGHRKRPVRWLGSGISPIFSAVPPVEPAAPTTRRIYLVRHGETLYGAGATGGDDLTPEGYRQIEALEELLRPTAIDAIYASPLERAQATARTLAGPSGVPITTVDTLREMIPGDLSLLTTTSTQDVAGFLRQTIGYFVDPATRWTRPIWVARPTAACGSACGRSSPS